MKTKCFYQPNPYLGAGLMLVEIDILGYVEEANFLRLSNGIELKKDCHIDRYAENFWCHHEHEVPVELFYKVLKIYEDAAAELTSSESIQSLEHPLDTIESSYPYLVCGEDRFELPQIADVLSQYGIQWVNPLNKRTKEMLEFKEDYDYIKREQILPRVQI